MGNLTDRTSMRWATLFIITASVLGAALAFNGLESGAMTFLNGKDKNGAPLKRDSHSDSGYNLTPPDAAAKQTLLAVLTPEQQRITQKAGTERAFCGTLLDNKRDGMYACVVCGLPLFASSDKFTSGTGWPSFTQPFDRQHVSGRRDNSLGATRIEILCTRCDSHLGHVFEDGPEPTGLRFCLNSESLRFFGNDEDWPQASQPDTAVETAYFAGGCFWGIEYAFGQLPGVQSATSGYQNGDTEDPTYKEVCNADTGHAESVRVRFDPARIDYETLVRFFFEIHDPTTLNRQHLDVGPQYRSGLFTTTESQATTAHTVIDELKNGKAFDGRKIVTEVESATTFFPAEQYHQDYVARTGRACHPGIGTAVEAYQAKLAKKEFDTSNKEATEQ
jgi:peptide methionine sulfoxide reductase msrA/msrB